MKQTDPIIRSLLNCRSSLRRNAAFDRAFPFLSYGVPSIAALAFYLNSSTMFLLGVITFHVFLVTTVCWLNTRRISLQQTASITDSALSLNDTFSSYLQFAGESSRTTFQQLHLRSVTESFTKGVEWQPAEPGPQKFGIVFLTMIFGLIVVLAGPNSAEPKILIADPVSESTRIKLVIASTKLSTFTDRELSVSLEQFSKTASPVTRKDRERIIEQIRNIQREINSSEAEFAGKFLSELLSKSTMRNSQMNAISRALRNAQWQKASQLARNISDADARDLTGKEREVLDALREHHAQVKTKKGMTDGPEPKSKALRKKLASLARQYSPTETADMLNALDEVRAALAETGHSTSPDSNSAGSPSATKANASDAVVAKQRAIGKPRALRAKAVNPLVAAGPGQSIAAIMELQDTGLSTFFPEPSQNKNFNKSNPVVRVTVPYTRRELVKAYFQQRNSDDLTQMEGSDD